MIPLLLAGSLALAAPVPKELKKKYPPDPERLLGAWEIVVNEDNGKPKPEPKVVVWTFTDGNMHSSSGNSNWKIVLDESQTPKHIDIGTYKGVYEFDGEKLTIVYAAGGGRPAEVKSAQGNYFVTLVKAKDQPAK